MLMLAITGIICFFFVLVVYLVYALLVYKNSSVSSAYLKKIASIYESSIILPNVSVIVNAFNESKIIRRKIEDISRLDYPHEKLEVVVVDDCSSDATGEVAEVALKDFQIKGKVLRNPSRLGLNASLNLAFKKSTYDVVCVTDSDVLLDHAALRKAVMVLECFEGAGGVTGKVVPLSSGATIASSSEDSYRSHYHWSMLSESSFHSAFPGNGPLIVFNKSLVKSAIPTTYGSTDANIAINIVKSGKRFLYLPDALIYEPVPETVEQQKLQKVRRAKRLIQVFIHNADVIGNRTYGKFGTILFPVKFSVHVLCPIVTLLSAVLLSAFVFINIFQFSLLVIAALLLSLLSFTFTLAISSRIRKFIVSFIFHQGYLLIGLFSSIQKSIFWKTIDRR